MSDLSIVSGIIIFITCLSFLSLLLPSANQFITTTSLIIFGLSTIGVAGFCVVATGIPCAIALGVSVGANFLAPSILTALGITLSASYTWIGSLLLTPINAILTIFIARIARGVAGGG